MKRKDNSLEWHDENELVRKLDVVEAVLNLADTIDDVVDVIMGVPSCKVQITTNTSMGSDGISTRQADTPQTDCDTCAESGSYKCTKCDGEMYYKANTPQTETHDLRTETHECVK